MATPHDPGTGIEVEVNDGQRHLAVEPARLVDLVRSVLGAEGVDRASVSLTLVDDDAIRRINRRHLGHDWPTDVISFALSGPDDAGLAAELVVSAEMAAATARGAGVDPMAELALYVAHGLLHVCGHDDGSPESAAAMRRRESEVLARAGYANTFDAVEAISGEGPPCSS